MNSKLKCIACFFGIFFFLSCSTQPKVENIPKTGYQDDFSKTFIKLSEEIYTEINAESRKKLIVVIGLRKYIPEYYIVKVGFLSRNWIFDAALLDEENNKYFYFNDLVYVIDVLPKDLHKFHEFDLKDNYTIPYKKKKYMKMLYPIIEGDYLMFYTMNDIDFKYQKDSDWGFFNFSWSMEDDLIPSFKNKLKSDTVSTEAEKYYNSKGLETYYEY